MKKLLKSKSGQALSEYVLLVFLIAIASITMATSVGRSLFVKLQDINTGINNANLEDVRNPHH